MYFQIKLDIFTDMDKGARYAELFLNCSSGTGPTFTVDSVKFLVSPQGEGTVKQAVRDFNWAGAKSGQPVMVWRDMLHTLKTNTRGVWLSLAN